MKILEITEHLKETIAGTEDTGILSWFRGSSREARRMQRAIVKRAKQFVPRWYAHAKTLTTSGRDLTDPALYIQELKKFASGKLPNLFDDAQGQKLANDLEIRVKQGNFNEKDLQDFLTKTIAHAQTLKSQPASSTDARDSQLVQAGAPGPWPPEGAVTFASGDPNRPIVTYWDSKDKIWRSANNQRMTHQRTLTKYYKSGKYLIDIGSKS